MSEGERLPSVRELIELGPSVVDRMAIEAKPGLDTVACYVLTRAAERAWQAINRRLSEPGGGVFWIGGESGSGKTHFLNYVLALDRNAGSPAGAKSQHLTIGIEAGKDLEARLLEALARALSLTQRETMPWRRMHGAEALAIALAQARRLGKDTVTVAVDFGGAQSDAAAEYFATLARACEARHPRLIVIGAGRGEAPCPASAFEVAPADSDEQAVVAIGRARRLKQGAKRAVGEFYRALPTGSFEAGAIFPFHPFSVAVLRALARPLGSVAEIARLARDALAPDGEIRDLPYRCSLTPADLLASAAICTRVEARLGEQGRAALKCARAAAQRMGAADGALVRQIVDTLMLAGIAGDSPHLSVAELRALLPAHWSGVLAPAGTAARIYALLTALADRTGGIIRFESNTARFDPRGARCPQAASFNAALPLVKRFDPSITEADELPDLKAKLKRLEDAMANALDAARHTGEVLAPVLDATADGRLISDRQTVLPNYMALASAGPAALLEAAADPARRDEALKTISAYESLAGAAAAAPRLWAMRDYLQATGLKWSYQQDSGKSKKIAALEGECQLLASQLIPAILLDENRNLEALQARFQQFRWSYVLEYRAAHEQWREEMRKLAAIAKDARDHLAASRRLSSIAAPGALAVSELETALKELEGRIVLCDLGGPLAPEVSPRCPRCGFVLGASSPRAELTSLFERTRDGLEQQLVALSRSVIARLIRERERTGRLKGLLDIIQAAQTDKLIRVLDDDLAAYLVRLVNENPLDGDTAAEAAKSVSAQRVFRRREQHPKAGHSKIRS